MDSRRPGPGKRPDEVAPQDPLAAASEPPAEASGAVPALRGGASTNPKPKRTQDMRFIGGAMK